MRCAWSVTMNTRSPATATPRLMPPAASPARPFVRGRSVVPDPAPGARVERVALVGGGHVHDAVHHDRRHFQPRGCRRARTSSAERGAPRCSCRSGRARCSGCRRAARCRSASPPARSRAGSARRPCAAGGCAGRRTAAAGPRTSGSAPAPPACGRRWSRPSRVRGAASRVGRSVRRKATSARMSASGIGKPGMPAAGSPSRTSAASSASSRAKSRVTMPGPSSPPLPSPPWQREQTASYWRRPASGDCAKAALVESREQSTAAAVRMAAEHTTAAVRRRPDSSHDAGYRQWPHFEVGVASLLFVQQLTSSISMALRDWRDSSSDPRCPAWPVHIAASRGDSCGTGMSAGGAP